MIQCKLCKIINLVEIQDASAIQSVLDTGDINNTLLAEVITSNGYPITEASVRRHQKHYNRNN